MSVHQVVLRHLNGQLSEDMPSQVYVRCVDSHILQEEKDKLSAADLVDAIRAAGKDRGDPFDDDEHLIAIMDDNSTSGITETDPVMATVDIDAAILCHELGHFFQHLNKVDSSHADTLPRFRLLEYGDPTCIMGAEPSKDAGGLGTQTFVDGLTLGRDSSLAAVSRDPRSIDVAAVAADGTLHVISASSDPNFVPADRQTLRTYEAMLIHDGAFVSALPFPLQQHLTLWNTEQVPGPAERFTIHELQDASETIDGTLVTKTLVAVQAVNGRFVTAEAGGGSMLVARADKVGSWEMFKLFTHPQNSDFRVFQALGGHTWRATGDGGGLVDCRGVKPLGWEEFTVA